VPPQSTSESGAVADPTQPSSSELVERLRTTVGDFPPVLHVVRPGLPSPAIRAIHRLIHAQRHFGMTVHATSVTGDAVPELSIGAATTADDNGIPVVHLHADLGDPLAAKLVEQAPTVQAVYTPTGHLDDHPARVPLVLVTEGVARGLRRKKINVHVVPPIIDEEWLRQPAAPIRTGRPAVGMLCGLQASAGADCFVSAVRPIADARPDAAFVIVGGGPREDALRQLAVRRGVGDIIRFVGPTDDGTTLLRRLDIVVCPARQDVTGLTALEAMAAGRPVVASRVGALSELLIQGETGRLIPPADATALAATVLRLLDRPKERQALVTAARAYVSRHHSAEVGVAASVEAYRAAIHMYPRRDGDGRLEDALRS
jgi:glycosyltransferase involved in cell wall biosynthesis